MIYRILKKSVKANAKKRAFFSGLGSIMSIDPTLPSASYSYKGQSQDAAMLAKDMQKIGNDFQTAIKKAVANESRNY